MHHPLPGEDRNTWSAIALAWQLGFLVVVLLGGFFAAGWWLDAYLGTSPWFLLMGMLLGVVTTMIVVYRLVQNILKK